MCQVPGARSYTHTHTHTYTHTHTHTHTYTNTTPTPSHLVEAPQIVPIRYIFQVHMYICVTNAYI
jgi:hypothetical protein